MKKKNFIKYFILIFIMIAGLCIVNNYSKAEARLKLECYTEYGTKQCSIIVYPGSEGDKTNKLDIKIKTSDGIVIKAPAEGERKTYGTMYYSSTTYNSSMTEWDFSVVSQTEFSRLTEYDEWAPTDDNGDVYFYVTSFEFTSPTNLTSEEAESKITLTLEDTDIVETNKYDTVKSARMDTAIDSPDINLVRPNDTFYYRIEMTNNTLIPAANIFFEDIIPQEFEIVEDGNGYDNSIIIYVNESGNRKEYKTNDRMCNAVYCWNVTGQYYYNVQNFNGSNAIQLRINEGLKAGDSYEIYVRVRPVNDILSPTASYNLSPSNTGYYIASYAEKSILTNISQDDAFPNVNTAYQSREYWRGYSNPYVVSIARPSVNITNSLSVADNSSLRPGDTATYEFEVTNNGDDDLSTVSIIDTIDSRLEIQNVTFDNNKFSNNSTNNNISFDLKDSNVLTPNEKIKITVSFKVKENLTLNQLGTITNTANVNASDGSSQVSSSDNSTFVVENSALSISETVKNRKDYYRIGDSAVFSITATNSNSNNVAASKPISIIDDIDSRFTYKSIDCGSSNVSTNLNGQRLTIVSQSLAKGSNITCDLTVDINSNIGYLEMIENVAYLYESKNNTNVIIGSAVESIIAMKPNVSVTKKATYTTQEINSAKRGSTYTYEITVKNNGETPLTDLELVDNVPAPLTITNNDTNPTTGTVTVNGNKVTWSGISLNENESKKLNIGVEVPSNATVGSIVKNKATFVDVDSNETSVTIVDDDLSITKTVDKTTAQKGDTLNYLITITNGGNANIDGDFLRLADELPEGLTISSYELDKSQASSVSTECNIENNNKALYCKINDLAPNNSLKVSLHTTVDDDTEVNSVENKAKLQRCDSNIIMCNDYKESKVTTSISALSPDLSIEETSSVDVIKNNDEFYYTITVKNNSNFALSNYQVVDTFDSKLKVLDGYQLGNNSNKGTISNNTISWDNISMEANETVSFKVEVKASGYNDGDIIENKVDLKKDGVVVANDNKDVEVVEISVINDNPTLTITKEVDKETAFKNDDITYTIKVKNTSKVIANNVLIIDELDNNLKIVDGKTADINDNKLSWNLTVLPDEEITLQFTVKATSIPTSGIVSNKAELKYNDDSKYSNEVSINVVIDNPKTGTTLSYIILILSATAITGIVIYNKHKNKIYKV